MSNDDLEFPRLITSAAAVLRQKLVETGGPVPDASYLNDPIKRAMRAITCDRRGLTALVKAVREQAQPHEVEALFIYTGTTQPVQGKPATPAVFFYLCTRGRPSFLAFADLFERGISSLTRIAYTDSLPNPFAGSAN